MVSTLAISYTAESHHHYKHCCSSKTMQPYLALASRELKLIGIVLKIDTAHLFW